MANMMMTKSNMMTGLMATTTNLEMRVVCMNGVYMVIVHRIKPRCIIGEAFWCQGAPGDKYKAEH